MDLILIQLGPVYTFTPILISSPHLCLISKVVIRELPEQFQIISIDENTFFPPKILDVKCNTHETVSQVELFSLASDKSRDVSDTSQLLFNS